MSNEKQPILFTGGGSLRAYLAQQLAQALAGLEEASLRRCGDAETWVDHLVEQHMPVVPKMDWGHLTANVRDGVAWVQALQAPVPSPIMHGLPVQIGPLSEDGRLADMDLLFQFNPLVPLPQGGIRGQCHAKVLVLYLYDVQEFAVFQQAIEANLAAMQALITEFTATFRALVKPEVEARLEQHRADVLLRDSLFRELGATHAKNVTGRRVSTAVEYLDSIPPYVPSIEDTDFPEPPEQNSPVPEDPEKPDPDPSEDPSPH